MSDVLVVIVTYNAMQWVEKCLDSVRVSSVKADVLVVDNCSTDGTRECIKSDYPDVELLESGSNLGFGAANNIGLRRAVEKDYKFVYLLNQDAWLEKHTLKTLIAASRPEYGILSPMQKDARGRLDRNFSRKCGSSLKVISKVAPDDRLVVTVPFVMAAHWLMRIDAIAKVGGFSPAFRQYGEDDNYIDRLHYCGLKCGVVPAASAVHDRAERKLPRDKRMRLKCVGAVVRMSNPANSYLLSLVLRPLELVGMCVKNFSLVPIRVIGDLMGRRKELRLYRKESKKKGAFL